MKTSERESHQKTTNNISHEGNNNTLKKEDWDDSTPVARQSIASDNFKGTSEPIAGKTIGGSGSGPGPGDTGGDFDRHGSGGKSVNDLVSHETINENQQNDESSERTEIETQAENSNSDKSYMPGSGAVRTSEDRIPQGSVDKDSIPPGAGTF